MRLIESLTSTARVSEIFSDPSLLAAMLRFEVALARAEARLGVIPEFAAQRIAAVAIPELFDGAALAEQSFRAGTPAIPLVKALTEKVRQQDPAAAAFVHWATTSQDVVDTALLLLLKSVRTVLDQDLDSLSENLRRLSEQHAHTVMLGRTLLQSAPPITFGLKAAGWLAAIQRCRERMDWSFQQALVLQFGGASGTLASLGGLGLEVSRALADELSLALPDAPLHSHRDRLAGLVSACGILTGSLGKLARDLSLLMQSEIRELAESGAEGRGGSSAMPHKQNPVGCALALAAANRMPGIVANFLSAMVQEHERGVGGWQAEWTTIAEAIDALSVAAASMAEVTRGLQVSPERMRAAIDATRGRVFSEKAALLLAKKLGRDLAHQILKQASERSLAEDRSLSAVLAEIPEVAGHFKGNALGKLESVEDYLGVADEFRQRLLTSAAKRASH